MSQTLLGLDVFDPEPPKDSQLPDLDGRSSQTLADLPVQNAVSLERLLAHKFPIDWFEAVAILLRTCEDSEVRALSFDPAHVIVRVDGTVNMTATAERSPIVDQVTAVRDAATLLRDLLPDVFPMPLRLAVTQALSTPPFYSTIRDFSEAIQYFERPDRKAIVQAVFQRWIETLDQHRHIDAKLNEHPENSDHRIEQPPRVNIRPSKRPAIVWGLAAASIVCVPLTLWVGFAPAAMESPVAAIEKAGAAVMKTTESIAGSIVSRVTSSQAILNPQAISESHANSDRLAPVAKPSEPSRNGRLAAATAVNRRPAEPRSVETPPTAFLSSAFLDPFRGLEMLAVVPQLDTNVELSSPPNGIGFNREFELPAVAEGISSRIYSTNDADVVPALAVYPHLPASAFVAQDNALMFDVLIDHAGKVETVKTLRTAATMGGTLRLTMNLSAAKSWRFQPAIKDGRNVRYRHTIWIPIP